MASNSASLSCCPSNPCSQLPFGNPASGVSTVNKVCWGGAGSCPNSKPKVQARGLAEVTRSLIGELPRLHLPSPGPNLSIQEGKAVDLYYRAVNEDAIQLQVKQLARVPADLSVEGEADKSLKCCLSQFLMVSKRPASADLPSNKLMEMARKVKRALEARLDQLQTPGTDHLWKLTKGQAEAILNMAGFLLHLAISIRTQDKDLIERFDTWAALGVTGLAAGSCGGESRSWLTSLSLSLTLPGWLFPMGEIVTAVKLAVEMNWPGFTKDRWIRCVGNLKRK